MPSYYADVLRTVAGYIDGLDNLDNNSDERVYFTEINLKSNDKDEQLGKLVDLDGIGWSWEPPGTERVSAESRLLDLLNGQMGGVPATAITDVSVQSERSVYGGPAQMRGQINVLFTK